jgi:hypothetical protein
MTDLRMIDGKADLPPALTSKLWAIEFADVKRLKCMSKEERIASLHAMATRVYKTAAVASEVYMRDKAETVELVRDNYDTIGPFFLELDDIEADARALLDIIRTSKARLTIALAVVEGDHPDPNGGNEADDCGGETVAA